MRLSSGEIKGLIWSGWRDMEDAFDVMSEAHGRTDRRPLSLSRSKE
jgi:hypothetical protein